MAQERPMNRSYSRRFLPTRSRADWGGIVICGKAGYNLSYNGTRPVPGRRWYRQRVRTDGLAGSGDAVAPAPIDNDNSGVFNMYGSNTPVMPSSPIKSEQPDPRGGNGTTIDHIR